MERKGVLFIQVFLAGFVLVFLSHAIVSAEATDSQGVLILPHVEANNDFFTGLSLLNLGDKVSEVRLIAYNQDGELLKRNEPFSLLPGARYLNSIADIFGYETASEVSWIKLKYSGEISGFALIGNDGQLARIPLQKNGKATLVLSYAISGNGHFTQIYILNSGSDFAKLRLSAYDREGILLKEVPQLHPLPSGQKVVGSVSDLFGEEVSDEISWIKVESDGELIGLALVGAADRLFSVPME